MQRRVVRGKPALWPTWLFRIGLLIIAPGAYFARTTRCDGLSLAGWGFALFAIAEFAYMIDHPNWTIVLFARTSAEVLALSAFILTFAGHAQQPGSSLEQTEMHA